MSGIATRTVDLSGPLGAAPGFFNLNIFDDAPNTSGAGAARRFRLDIGNIVGEQLRIPMAALPAFQAAVGGAQMFVSGSVNLTTTPSGIALVPATPGYFFVPNGNDPLRVVNLSSAGTMSVAPTIRCGNNGTHDNYGSGAMDAGAFVGSTARVTRPAFGSGQTFTLIDLATPIAIDVTAAGSGSGFAWSVAFALAGWIVPAF
jgi:hypothetical protein